MKQNVACVIGVGMTKFERCETEFTELIKEAVGNAMKMAGVGAEHLEQAYAGYVNGMSNQGQHALYGEELRRSVSNHDGSRAPCPAHAEELRRSVSKHDGSRAPS